MGPSPDPGHLQPVVGLGHGPVSPKHPVTTLEPSPGHYGALMRDIGLWHTGTPGLWQRGRVGAWTCPQLHQQGLPKPLLGAEERGTGPGLPIASPPLVAHVSPMAGSCPALPAHVRTSVITEGLSDGLPTASPELFSQQRQCWLHMCTITLCSADSASSAVGCCHWRWEGESWLNCSLSRGPGSRRRCTSHGHLGRGEPRAGQRSPEPGCAGRSGAVACWKHGFWLTNFPSPAASPGPCAWPAVSVLCSSNACIPPVIVQVARLRAGMAVEVPPWRRAGSLCFPCSPDIPLGHGSAGGTQQILQQR